MTDHLESAPENVTPPTCPDCHTEMKWYQAVLMKKVAPATAIHFFQCPNCGQLQQKAAQVDLNRGASDAGLPSLSQ